MKELFEGAGDCVKRVAAIDFLKLLAVVLITNHHFGKLWGDCSFLATGGPIGNALFFFCSGYTLHKLEMGGGCEWYGRRLSRILPSVMAWTLICNLIFDASIGITDVLSLWFVETMLLFYVLFYLVEVFFRNIVSVVFWIAVVLIPAIYLVMGCEALSAYDPRPWLTDPECQWFLRGKYFIFVLLGLVIRHRELNVTEERPRGTKWFGLLVLSICLYFILSHGPALVSVLIGKTALATQIGWMMNAFTFPMIAGIVLCAFRFAQSEMMTKILTKESIRWIVLVVSGLSLDVYLVHFRLITDRFNGLFPLNFVIVYAAIFVLAWMNRALGRFISMTLSPIKGPRYDWSRIFSLK